MSPPRIRMSPFAMPAHSSYTSHSHSALRNGPQTEMQKIGFSWQGNLPRGDMREPSPQSRGLLEMPIKEPPSLYRTQTSVTLYGRLLTQINPIHAFNPNLYRTYFNIKGLLCFDLPLCLFHSGSTANSAHVYTCHVSQERRIQCPRHSSLTGVSFSLH
jgi:hypothetical protein